MPLTDVVLILNSALRPLARRLDSDFRFVWAGRRVLACYGSLRLESRFVPLVDVPTGNACGHRAALLATRQGFPEAVHGFADREGGPLLESLVRTLHALNYILRPDRANLLLQVRHLKGSDPAPDWGLAGEEILRPCRLLPKRIFFEVEAGKGWDQGGVAAAVRHSRVRGYGLAASLPGHGVDLDMLYGIRPDIVKLPVRSPASEDLPWGLIGLLHKQGARVMLEVMDSAILRRQAPVGPLKLPRRQLPEEGALESRLGFRGGQRQRKGFQASVVWVSRAISNSR